MRQLIQSVPLPVHPAASRMTTGDLQRLVKTGEGTYLEFKRAISSPEKIARELAAFANTRGGTLLIGVNDDKSLVGVASYYEEEYHLDKALNFHCTPAIHAQIELFEWKEREIIIVKVEESNHKPVYVNSEDERQVYIRVKDKSIRASKEVIQVLKNETSSSGISFNYGPNEQKLFRYLHEYERITVREFSNLVNISNRRALRTLVSLVSAGVLRLFTHEKTDYFTLSQEVF